MIKLSKIFENKKVLISIIVVALISLIVTLFLLNIKNIKNLDNKIANDINKTEKIKKYEYKLFKPTFPNNYDYTQDMKMNEKIYYKKINNYDEYEKIKKRWNNIFEMTEKDFENNFMIITAIENTNMVGLVLDKIETDKNTLYISLKTHDNNETFDMSNTCIAYKISRELERPNICVTRNLKDNEKDFSKNVKILENKNGTRGYINKNDIEKEKNNPNSTYTVKSDIKDFISNSFYIDTDISKINFSNWNQIGDQCYYLDIKNYSEYLKVINNYDVPKLKWEEFKYIYPKIIVDKNKEYSIETLNIEENKYLNIKRTKRTEENKEKGYSVIVIFMPNCRSLKENALEIKIK